MQAHLVHPRNLPRLVVRILLFPLSRLVDLAEVSFLVSNVTKPGFVKLTGLEETRRREGRGEEVSERDRGRGDMESERGLGLLVCRR